MNVTEYVEKNYSQNKETKMIERIACYIRVSTQEQKLHGLSLDAQRSTLTRYAEEHGLKIVGWYEDEGVSGTKLIRKRPALQRMINDAEKGLFDRIIFIKLDRYFRSVSEYYECQKILEANNVLWTATEEVYDLTTASGQYWITQKLAMAQYEAGTTSERIKLVNDYKIRTGQALAGPQSQGLAFTVKKDSEGIKRVVPDPETKDLVMDYINHYLIHQNKRQAMIDINAKYGTSYSYRVYSDMLKDTKLYGAYRYNPNYCEAYVDKETFDRIQELLKGNGIKRKNTSRVYLFSNLLTCPKCGRKLCGSVTTKSRSVGKKGQVYKYNYDILSYRCPSSAINKSCDFNKHPNDKKLEAYLIDHFDRYVTSYIANAEIEDNKEVSPDLSDRIKEIKTEMKQLNTMFRKSRVTEAEYDKEYSALEIQLEALESRIEPIKERDLTIYKGVLESGWKELYEALTRENKRAFWRKYIKEIKLSDSGAIKELIFF